MKSNTSPLSILWEGKQMELSLSARHRACWNSGARNAEGMWSNLPVAGQGGLLWSGGARPGGLGSGAGWDAALLVRQGLRCLPNLEQGRCMQMWSCFHIPNTSQICAAESGSSCVKSRCSSLPSRAPGCQPCFVKRSIECATALSALEEQLSGWS